MAKVIPVFQASINSDGQLTFWCPWCLKAHAHGMENDMKVGIHNKTHRTAHCYKNESPMRDTGYFMYLPSKTGDYKKV